MAEPVLDLRNVGTLRTKGTVSNSPADEFSSKTVVAPADTVTQISNYGVPVEKILGDGRKWLPILGSAPSTAVPGTIFIQTIAGQEYVAYVDAAGVTHYLTNGAPSPISPTAVVLSSLAPTPNVLASKLVDSVGVIEWSVGISDETTGKRGVFKVLAAHNGTSGADATYNGSRISYTGGPVVGTFDLVLDLNFTGSGVTQNMQLIAITGTSGLTAYVVEERMVAPSAGAPASPGSSSIPVYIYTGSQNLLAQSHIAKYTGTGGHTFSLPAANSLGAGNSFGIVIKHAGSGALAVNTTGGDTVDGGASVSLTGTPSRQSITAYADGVSDWMLT